MEVITFNNLDFNFSNNYYNTLNFKVNNIPYSMAVSYNPTPVGYSTPRLMLYIQDVLINQNPMPNIMYKAKDFNYMFVLESSISKIDASNPNTIDTSILESDNDFGITTIFSKYKLCAFY